MNRRLAVLALTGVALLTACAGSAVMSSNASPPRGPAEFQLTEWAIRQGSGELRAGRQTITATNAGHHTHELVIVAAPSAASLPTKADGSVDEAKLEAVKVGEIADVAAGKSTSKTFDLTPGTYVAFCNMVDSMNGRATGGGMMASAPGSMGEHVHFALGMHVTFTVR